jgi:alpha-D-ribose 1-methylphosphonate 5-triphosphate synthase subunit PhnH
MTRPMMGASLKGGFADAPIDSAHAFRAALTALSQPGMLQKVEGALPPAPISAAAGVLLLVLADATTPVHLAGAHDCADCRDWIRFHTGAPLVAASDASFALGSWQALSPVERFAVGLPDYPDRSCTLIIEMPELLAKGARLSGPGIKGSAQLSLPEVAAFQANRALFPLGFDAFLTSGDCLAGLPRSTHVEAC